MSIKPALSRIEQELARGVDPRLFEYLKLKLSSSFKTFENINSLLAHEHYEGAKELSSNSIVAMASFHDCLVQMEELSSGEPRIEPEIVKESDPEKSQTEAVVATPEPTPERPPITTSPEEVASAPALV